MLTIIDRYIAKNFIAFFIAGMVVCASIFLAVDVLEVSRGNSGVLSSTLFGFYKYYAPIIFYQIMPVGALVATLFTLTSLNKNNELIALFSLGLSLARISLPILALVSLISVVNYWMGDRLVPVLAQKKNYVWYVEIRKKPGLYATVKQDKIWYRSDNTIFNIQSMNAEQGRAKAQGITMYYFDEAWNLVQLVKAKSVQMLDRIWNLEDGTVTLFAEESSFPLTKSFSKKTLTMGDDLADIRSASPDSATLSIADLRRFIQKNKEAGLDTLRFEVDLHAKMAFAFSALVLSMLGIPFTVQKGRAGGMMKSVGISITLAFIYWMIFSASLSLGKSGVIPPFISAWAPNTLFSGLAAYLLIRLKR